MKATGTLAFLAVVATPLWAQCDLEKILPTNLAADDQVNHAALSGDRMLVGAWKADHQGIDSGAAYIFGLNSEGTWVQEQELVGSDVGADGWFGKHVALDGDVAVVGCPEEFAAGDPPGEAYVFRRNGSSWEEEQILRPTIPDPDARFGAGVDVDGDTIIVGAYKAFGTGRAYVYHREGSMWVEQAVLQSPDPSSNDSFASHGVGICGDFAVVGSRYDHELGTQAGAAFIFRREGSTWVQEQKLLASDGAAGDHLGWWAAIDGLRVVVGALDADSTGDNAGAGYVFERIDGVWVETGKLVGSDTLAGDRLGYVVDISGDYAMIGARNADDLGADSGEAYLFEWINGQWVERTKYLAPDGGAGDLFGTVALDGQRTAISAYGDDNAAGIDAGAIYVAPLPTTAKFSSSRTLGVRTLTVSFQDLSLGNVTSYLWDFGDGFFSTLQNPIYTYNMPGTYTVMLTVDGPCGMSSETKVDYIQVLPRPRLPWFGPPPTEVPNLPPVADFSATPLSGLVPLTVTFSDQSSGRVRDWSWSFGDGTGSMAQNPTHTYDAPGDYTVALTVSGLGGSDTETKPHFITVADADTTPPAITCPPDVFASGTIVDDFDGTSLDPSWSLLNPSFITYSVSGGELHMQPTMGGPPFSWFADEEGPLIYRTVTGDFTATATLRVEDPNNPGQTPPPPDRFGGLVVRDPASASGDRNSLSVSLGAGANPPPVAEDKTTDGSVSDFVFHAITQSAGDVRIVRTGSLFSLQYRAPGAPSFQILRAHDRPDMPATLNVGQMAFSFSTLTPPDVIAHFDRVSITNALTVVDYPPPTVVDDFDPSPTVVCSPPSGSAFPLGTTTVVCTATDASGNSSMCTFTVTVNAVATVGSSGMRRTPGGL